MAPPPEEKMEMMAVAKRLSPLRSKGRKAATAPTKLVVSQTKKVTIATQAKASVATFV